MTESIRWEQDDDGIVVLCFDDPHQAANTMNADYFSSMERTVERLEADAEKIEGVILTSSKRTFFAGGDLDELIAVEPRDAAAFARHVSALKSQLRRLELVGKPVVAAINGSALGGGLEIALATHHRIVADEPRLELGFPEVTLGLMPGAGGVTRSVRLLGILPALRELLLSGRRLNPAEALELGLIDEVQPPEELIAAARRWIAEVPDAKQPWDGADYEIPGGTPTEDAFIPALQALPAQLTDRLGGAPYPAPHAILAAAVEGAQVDLANASEVEGRYFVSLVTHQTSKNMIQGNFLDLNEVKRRARAHAVDIDAGPIDKVAVLGAGMMGAGIAFVCAKAGFEVILCDVDVEAAGRGKRRSEDLVAKGRHGGDAKAGQELLSRIHPTDRPGDAAGAQLMIEAVFEDPEVKTAAYARTEPVLAGDALLASNTSTLPITKLAAAVSRPADFIGLHFFSPVDKMPLIEIVRGAETSPAAVGRALDFALRLGKTPILVNDSQGFFTSRVIRCFYDEGVSMLLEGVPAPTIEQASKQAGYPVPVLQLCDELNLNLIRSVREERRAAIEAKGARWNPHPADSVFDRMLDELGRGGRLAGAGFYDYREGRRTGLWPGLAKSFPPALNALPSLPELQERMLFIEALEAARCLEEGVIESAADANVGSILGIGYPRWTGGVFQFIEGHEDGAGGFIRRATELSETHGERFTPPPILVRTASSGEPLGRAPRTSVAAA